MVSSVEVRSVSSHVPVLASEITVKRPVVPSVKPVVVSVQAEDVIIVLGVLLVRRAQSETVDVLLIVSFKAFRSLHRTNLLINN